MDLNEIEKKLSQKIYSLATLPSNKDPAHDFLHFKRVTTTAKALCQNENANLEIVLPAAWLHDFVIIPKNDPRRNQASRLSAEAAVLFLQEINYPEKYFNDIAHAIEAHSFSANIETKTLEAKIVQDADRLDGLGAIGIARCFATAGILKTSFYSDHDPWCELRTPDDKKFTLDHFFVKLFKTVQTLKTESGKKEGLKRAQVMQEFLNHFRTEI